MLSADSYRYIFLFVVSVLTLLVINFYNNMGKNWGRASALNNYTLFLAIFFSVFIGLRPIDIAFVDMISYSSYYEWLSKTSKAYTFDTDNVIFDNLFLYFAKIGIPIGVFFLVVSFIYFFGTFIGIRRIFKNHQLFAYIVWLGSFSTFSYGVNGIKAGASAALFIVALSYYDKKILSAFIALISLGFHHSMQLPIAAYVVSILFKKDIWYFRAWIMCMLIALLHITYFQAVFAGWTDDQGASYLSSVDAEFVKHKGFRIDFVVYSAMPVILGYYAVIKYGFRDKLYGTILRTYTLANAVWMLCMYAPFNNRIAYLSWLMYPIVIIYPCLKKEKFNTPLIVQRNIVAGLNLSFTLFMNLIYY